MKVIISENCDLEITFEKSIELSNEKKQAIKDINLIARDSGINIKLL